MARPGATGHRKFVRLKFLLGCAPLALGCLELIWEKCCINGDDYLGDSTSVEALAEWPGKPGELCQALLNAGGEGESGYIEEVPGRPGLYRCHDFYDHAPRYVATRMLREADRRAKGQTLSAIRAEAGSKGGKQTSSKRAANEQQTSSKKQQVNVTPAPAPAPAPLKACAEPGKSDSTPVVLELPCAGSDGKSWPVTEGMLRQWGEAFPGVDPMTEARKMLLWLQVNDKRRKTARGMGRFVMGWLEKAQNSHGGSRASPPRVLPLRPGGAPSASFAIPKLLRTGDPT
jgi:hypothetical protein